MPSFDYGKRKEDFMNEVLNDDVKVTDMLAKEMAKLIKSHEHKYDRTFSSAVKGINKDCTYAIMDDGGVSRNVRCAIPNAILRVGQYVWVKVPSGRLEDMHICGVKSSNGNERRTINENN